MEGEKKEEGRERAENKKKKKEEGKTRWRRVLIKRGIGFTPEKKRTRKKLGRVRSFSI